MSSSGVCIYVAQLEHGKFYVGASDDPVKAVVELGEGLGTVWTQIHRPLRILEQHRFKKAEELDKYVKLAMRKYGVENVRGGSWTSLRLSDRDRHALHSDADDIMCVIS